MLDQEKFDRLYHWARSRAIKNSHEFATIYSNIVDNPEKLCKATEDWSLLDRRMYRALLEKEIREKQVELKDVTQQIRDLEEETFVVPPEIKR